MEQRARARKETFYIVRQGTDRSPNELAVRCRAQRSQLMRVMLGGAMRVHTLGLVAVATVVACNTGTEPFNQLALTVTADPSVVIAHTELAVTIAVTNPTPYSITVTTPSSCALRFEVHDANGTLVGAPLALCLPTLMDLTLTPGQTASHTYPWRADVPPGTYVLVGTLSTVDGGRRSPDVALTVH